MCVCTTNGQKLLITRKCVGFVSEHNSTISTYRKEKLVEDEDEEQNKSRFPYGMQQSYVSDDDNVAAEKRMEKGGFAGLWPD